MVTCVVKGCSNTTNKPNKADKVTFHRIPSDPIIAERWIEKLRLNRKEICWKPSIFTRICSSHFEDKEKYFTKHGLCKIHQNAVPTKGLHIHCTETNPNRNDNLINPHELDRPQLGTLCNEKNENVETLSRQNQMTNTKETQTSNGILSNEENENVETVTTNPFRQNQMTNTNETQTSIIHDNGSSADDLDSIFDTPRKASLRIQLKKKKLLQRKNRRQIQTLQQRNRRLEGKNLSLKKILLEFKNKTSRLKKKNSSLQKIILELQKKRF